MRKGNIMSKSNKGKKYAPSSKNVNWQELVSLELVRASKSQISVTSRYFKSRKNHDYATSKCGFPDDFLNIDEEYGSKERWSRAFEERNKKRNLFDYDEEECYSSIQ